jgi:hypothetical protein
VPYDAGRTIPLRQKWAPRHAAPDSDRPSTGRFFHHHDGMLVARVVKMSHWMVMKRIVLEPTAATRPEKVAAEVRSGRFTRRIGHCALFPGRCPVPIIGPEEPTRQTDTSIRATGAVYAPALFGRRTSIEALCLCLRFPREPQTNRCCCFSAKRS